MKQHTLRVITCILFGVWISKLSFCSGQTRVHENNKSLDTKQIESLELQLTQIRQRIDKLRKVSDPNTPDITQHLARRLPKKFVVTKFQGVWHTQRGSTSDFRISDRVITVREIDGKKQITGYGVVVNLESDDTLFDDLAGSSILMEDEVYVVNREDTSASIVNLINQRNKK